MTSAVESDIPEPARPFQQAFNCLMEKMKVANMVRPVTDLSSMVPGDVKEGTSTLGKIMKFAKSQNITNIPNSEKATASLGEL